MTDAFRALMSGTIDYAGLFPPAGRPMTDAVQNYALYRAGPHAWMLGRFVVPVARLEEFVAAFTALPSRGDDSPWLLSVIAKASDAAALATFNARYGSRTRIDMVEVSPVRQDDIALLAPLAASYTVFAEVASADDPAPLIALIGQDGLGAKIRTGGVTAEAFPTPDAVARFIAACSHSKVRFKATAGLHHLVRAEYPLTYEPGCARATMYGFMNMLAASAAATAGAAPAELGAILSERSTTAITFDTGGMRVGTRVIAIGEIVAARASGMASFGSCSFEEPVTELTDRGFL